MAGETYGMSRAGDWLGRPYELAGRGPDAYKVIEAKLQEGGHGSSAAIVNEWQGLGAHAWNAFNRHGEVKWCDPQDGVSDSEPLYMNVRRVWCIAIDREGNPL